MKYLLIGAAQCLAFLILVVNLRAIQHYKMKMVIGSDFLYCLVHFFVIRRIAEASSFWEALAYATGGTVGSVIALRLTKKWDLK